MLEDVYNNEAIPPTLRRIKTSPAERIAAANPPYSAEQATDGAVLLHGFDEILAAGRLKPAVAAQERADQPLVEPGRAKEGPGRQPPQEKSHRSVTLFS